MISNTKGWKKNRINDESMENWSALHINGRKVHYREQSLVVATAKIIIMSALGPNPCLAPSSASISKIQNTFGVKSLFYQPKFSEKDERAPLLEFSFMSLAFLGNSINNNHQYIGAHPFLAPLSASISWIPYTFGVTSLFVCLNKHLQRRMGEYPCLNLVSCL